MSIRVEFYGIPRSRAGVEVEIVELDTNRTTLGNVLVELASRFPELRECIDKDVLRSGFRACIDGERFVSRSDELLPVESSLLVMSADAGG